MIYLSQHVLSGIDGVNQRAKYTLILTVIVISMMVVVLSGAGIETSVAQGPTPSPSPTPSLEEKVTQLQKQIEDLNKKVEKPPKDVWDIISSISGLVSGILIAIIGCLATYVYRERERTSAESHNRQQLAVLQVQTIQSFMPQLQSGNEKAIEAALLAITALGNTELTTNLAKLYKGSGTISALTRIADSPDQVMAQQAKQSLATFAAESEKRVAQLMRLFKGQTVSGALFGLEGDMTLPVFTNVILTAQARDHRTDIEAESPAERWLVEVKLRISSIRDVKRIVNMLGLQRHRTPTARIWLVVMSPLDATYFREIRQQQEFLVSSLPEIEKLEEILSS